MPIPKWEDTMPVSPTTDIPKWEDTEEVKSNPSLIERFKAGFMGKEIPQPKGFERGDVAEFAGSSGLETLGGTLGTPFGPTGIGLGAAGGYSLHKGIRNIIDPETATTPLQVATGAGVEGLQQGLGAKYLPVAVKGISKGISAIGEGAEKLSSRTINSLIKPKMVDFVYGKNPGKAVADEGIIATSLEDLVSKISSKKQEIGRMYEPILAQNKGKVVDLSETIKPIDDAIAKLSDYPETHTEVLSRLDGVRKDIIQNLVKNDVTGSWGLTPESAIALKRGIGTITKFTGNQSDDAIVNSSLKQAYHIIDDKLDKAIPGIQGINERYANLLGAETSAKWRSALLSRQDMTHLPEMITGMGSGLLTGNPVTGIGVGLVHKALGSTPAKTLGAQGLLGISRGMGAVAKPISDISESKAVEQTLKYTAPGIVTSTEELMRRYNNQK